MILLASACGTPPAETAPPTHTTPHPTTVDLEARITAFTSGLDERRHYRPPGYRERTAVAKGTALLLDGRRRDAGRELARAGYALTELTDRPSGRRYAEIAERTGAQPARGWGRVYVELSSAPKWSVQVPHPVADARSEMPAVRLVRAAPGGVLVLAGAHRTAGRGNAADVAHRTDTVFHTVVRALVDRKLPGVQLHGFADKSAPGFDVVASTGAGTAALADGRSFADAMREQELRICRAWARRCELAGRTNVQGRAAAAAEVPFLHVEFSRTVRDDETRIRKVVRSLTKLVKRWS
ncbi:hypothetical protein [Streptomyces halobius]|uniref:Lipoprotein n=1 Tax=Streptomyces halobius TaxID=2879846 RepID=A0ABY4MH87_9ACTN|nr:hypothetical protein [Streptomyces halobius]UQA96463.1 hypothetical protein K9S39_35375 [Streptomyces halobius]